VFNVKITDTASADIDEAFAWWSGNRSEEQAKRWYKAIKLAIGSLRRMPERCPAVPEKNLSIDGVKELYAGIGKLPTHRIVFVIDGDHVVILRVRHHGQDALGSGDVTV
jgi:plasmid stabilization system protein ParE